MAPQASKRRRISGLADTKKKQPTLSFRPTKSGLVAPSAQKPTEYEPNEKPVKAQTPKEDQDTRNAQDEGRATTSANESVAEAEEEESEEEEDEIAEKVNEAKLVTRKQVETYWRNKEKSRKAPRVHQQDLSISEKILREWDLSSHFGPSMGISRQDRWKRAFNLDMHPPIEVLAVLVNEEKLKLNGSKRSSGKGKVEAVDQTSILDELILSSKLSAGPQDVGVEA